MFEKSKEEVVAGGDTGGLGVAAGCVLAFKRGVSRGVTCLERLDLVCSLRGQCGTYSEGRTEGRKTTSGYRIPARAVRGNKAGPRGLDRAGRGFCSPRAAPFSETRPLR